MDNNNLFKLMAIAGAVLGGIGAIMTTWADGRDRDAVIEEKVNEALAAREKEENEAEEP